MNSWKPGAHFANRHVLNSQVDTSNRSQSSKHQKRQKLTNANDPATSRALLADFAEALSRCDSFMLSKHTCDRVIRSCKDLDTIARILYRYPGPVDAETFEYVYKHIFQVDHKFKERTVRGTHFQCDGRDDVIMFLARHHGMSAEQCAELFSALGRGARGLLRSEVRAEFLDEICLHAKYPPADVLTRLYLSDRITSHSREWIDRWLPRLAPDLAAEMLKCISGEDKREIPFFLRSDDSGFLHDLSADPRTMLTAASGSMELVDLLSREVPIADIISACFYTGRAGFAVLAQLVAADAKCLRAHVGWSRRLDAIFVTHFHEHELEDLGPLLMLLLRQPCYVGAIAAFVNHFGFGHVLAYVASHETDPHIELPCLIEVMHHRAPVGEILDAILTGTLPPARQRVALLALVSRHYGDLHRHSYTGIAELIANFAETHRRLPVGDEFDSVAGRDDRDHGGQYWRISGMRYVCPQAYLRLKDVTVDVHLEEYLSFLADCVAKGIDLELSDDDRREVAQYNAERLMPLLKTMVANYDRVDGSSSWATLLAVVAPICGDMITRSCEESLLALNEEIGLSEFRWPPNKGDDSSELQQRARLRNTIDYYVSYYPREAHVFFWKHLKTLRPLAAERLIESLSLHLHHEWQSSLLQLVPRGESECINILATWLFFLEYADHSNCRPDILQELCKPSEWTRNDEIVLLHERMVALGRYRGLEYLYRACGGASLTSLLNVLHHKREIKPVAAWLARNRRLVEDLVTKCGIDEQLIDKIVADGESQIVEQLVSGAEHPGEITDHWMMAHDVNIADERTKRLLVAAAAKSGRSRWILYLCGNYWRWAEADKELIWASLAPVQSTYDGMRYEAAEDAAKAFAADALRRRRALAVPMEALEELLWCIAVRSYDGWHLLDFFVTTGEMRARRFLARHAAVYWQKHEHARELMIADGERDVCCGAAAALADNEGHGRYEATDAIESARTIANGLRAGILDAQLALDLVDVLYARFHLSSPLTEVDDYVEGLIDGESETN